MNATPDTTHSEAHGEMVEQLLAEPQAIVGRDAELAELRGYLDRALQGHTQVAFITGEAGSGKTTLVHEFARYAQQAHPDLLVAIGTCNAQTGLTDPYLPFLEVLRLLIGDLQADLAANVVDAENAARLKGMLNYSAQVLADIGPNLLELLFAAVPGGGLLANLGTSMFKKSGLLEKLQKDKGPAGKSNVPDPSSLDQNRLFEQYTNMLKAVASRKPLLVILDDLQWADPASIALLFHLSRRLGDVPVMLLGAYRRDEVTMGRGDEKHPLEKVMAEFKRYYGDIWIDLDEARRSNGRAFIDSLLDRTPNRLDSAFRDALLQHTGGHPLFTVELLSEMKERGALVRDGEGRWVAAPSLDWTALPARMEGVIEERLGRISDEERDILNVASVEGADFTAQVVARVQEVKERTLFTELSRQLGSRHHLVEEKGEVKAGRHILSRYAFTHTPIQQYLYHDLPSGERRLLHGQIATVLEELYAGRTDQITAQLGWHYAEAGDGQKAIDYLLQASGRARTLYANEEAIKLLQQARRIFEATLPEDYGGDWHGKTAQALYEALGDVLALKGQYEDAREAFEEALDSTADSLGRARVYRKIGKTWEPQRGYTEALDAYSKAEAALGPRDTGEQHADEWWQEWVQIQLVRMWIYHWRGEWQQMQALVEQVQGAVERYGTPAQRSKFFTALVLTAMGRDRYTISDETLRYAQLALEAIRDTGSPGEIGLTEIVLGYVYLLRGELDQAEAQVSDALKQAERNGDAVVQSRALAYLTMTYRRRALVQQTRDYARRTIDAATSLRLLEDVGTGWANIAWAEWREGQYKEAQEHAQAALDLWYQLSLAISGQWMALLPLMAIAVRDGQLDLATRYARAMLQPTQMRLPEKLEAALQDALSAWEKGNEATARAALQNAVSVADELNFL